MKEYRIPSSTFYYWTKHNPREIVNGLDDEHTISSWHRLNSHCKKIEAEIAFLQRTIVKDFTLKDRMAIIDKEYTGEESIHALCEALNVDRSTYLNHKYRNKNDDAWSKKHHGR